MAWKEILTDSSYYEIPKTTFRNSLYSLNISLEQKYTHELFKEDNTRIVYSKNNFALRKRSQTQQTNNLNFPFLNYRCKSIKNGGNRKWFNFEACVGGIFIPILNRKLRINPITIEYESTLWYQRDDDMNFVFRSLSYDNATETKVPYIIQILGQDVEMPGILNYDLKYDNLYDEKDWLEKNKIHTISLDFSVQTFYIMDQDVSIPDKVIFTFAHQQEIDTTDLTPSNIFEMAINHYEEENTLII